MHVMQPTHHEFMMDVDGWIFDLTIDKGELMLRNINFVYSDEWGLALHQNTSYVEQIGNLNIIDVP